MSDQSERYFIRPIWVRVNQRIRFPPLPDDFCFQRWDEPPLVAPEGPYIAYYC